jgi:hypothetical protein
MTALQGLDMESIKEFALVAIRAHFDGDKVVLPAKFRGGAPREVLVIFEDAKTHDSEDCDWLNAQEAAFALVWDNDEDAVYDSL